MDIYYDGLIVGAFAFACIGVFHPIVIKAEFYFRKNMAGFFSDWNCFCFCFSVFTECCFEVLCDSLRYDLLVEHS